MDALILTSRLGWEYQRSPAKNLFFCRVSKIGNDMVSWVMISNGE
jgi:hypothetical protein